jgi:hypothetical protein
VRVAREIGVAEAPHREHEIELRSVLVRRRDARWQVLGVVQADHIAEVGIPLRLLPSDAYDHLALFAGLAHSLDPAYIAEMSLQKDGRWLRKPKARPARVE